MTNSISFENTGSTVENMGQVVGYKLSLEEYKKFVINFELHIAEIWSNNRKMKQKLLKEINEDDNNEFLNLESRYKSSTSFTSGSKFSYFGELVFEILDFLFPQFCADAFSITNDQDTNNTDCILNYLAHQNFKGHLGFLQHWYRSRLNDEKGQHFPKFRNYEIHLPSIAVKNVFFLISVLMSVVLHCYLITSIRRVQLDLIVTTKQQLRLG